jgi:hypothetical protein
MSAGLFATEQYFGVLNWIGLNISSSNIN